MTATLNHEEIKKGLKRITRVQPFIYKYNWEAINLSSEKDDLRKFEKNNQQLLLMILHAKKEKIYPVHVSKRHSNRKKR